MKLHFAQSADLITQAGHSSEQLSSRSEKLQHYDHQYNHPQHYSGYKVTSLWRFNTNIDAGLSEPTHRGKLCSQSYTSSTSKFTRWIIGLKQHKCSLTMWNVSSTVLCFSHRWKVHMGTGPRWHGSRRGRLQPSHTTCCSSRRKVSKCISNNHIHYCSVHFLGRDQIQLEWLWLSGECCHFQKVDKLWF